MQKGKSFFVPLRQTFRETGRLKVNYANDKKTEIENKL